MTDDLIVHLIEDRNARVSPYGRGNSKIGKTIYTYSRLPGRLAGTCPGATAYCESVCYAKRVVHNVPVWDLWRKNTEDPTGIPMLPKDAKVLRWHVSGDFDTVEYILDWLYVVRARRNVRFYGYSRSWRVPDLSGPLMVLRDEPNVQLFASVDPETPTSDIRELHSEGWRVAWIDDGCMTRSKLGDQFRLAAPRFKPIYVCPEETGRKASCADCRYCIDGKRGDVVFLLHTGNA